jgi:hypothetical protein
LEQWTNGIDLRRVEEQDGEAWNFSGLLRARRKRRPYRRRTADETNELASFHCLSLMPIYVR